MLLLAHSLGMRKHRTMGHAGQNRRERRKFVASLNREADARAALRRRRANHQYTSVLELMNAERK